MVKSGLYITDKLSEFGLCAFNEYCIMLIYTAIKWLMCLQNECYFSVRNSSKLNISDIHSLYKLKWINAIWQVPLSSHNWYIAKCLCLQIKRPRLLQTAMVRRQKWTFKMCVIQQESKNFSSSFLFSSCFICHRRCSC